MQPKELSLDIQIQQKYSPNRNSCPTKSLRFNNPSLWKTILILGLNSVPVKGMQPPPRKCLFSPAFNKMEIFRMFLWLTFSPVFRATPFFLLILTHQPSEVDVHNTSPSNYFWQFFPCQWQLEGTQHCLLTFIQEWHYVPFKCIWMLLAINPEWEYNCVYLRHWRPRMLWSPQPGRVADQCP